MERAAGYLHGADRAEQARLEAQARYLGGADFLPPLRSGMRMLDVGCGTGAIAREIAPRVAPAEVIGVDREPAQIETARRLAEAEAVGNVRFLLGEASALELPDASFDAAFCRFVLDHVSDPTAVVGEMRRVVAPGGWICAYEWEVGCFTSHPGSQAIDQVWRGIYELQRQLGGDPWLARKLYGLLGRIEGLEDVAVEVRAWTATAGDAARLTPYVEAARQVFDEARDGLLSAGWVTRDVLAQAAADYDRLLQSREAFVAHGFCRALARRARAAAGDH